MAPRRALAKAGLRLALPAALLLAAPSAAEEARPDLADRSLEELLETRLGGMRITGIHHTHEAGEWMVGFSSMGMHMDGSRSGTSSRSDAEVLEDFMVTPTSMDAQMHMLHLMYAPTEDWTLTAMAPWVYKSMDHETRSGETFTTRSSGLGDLRLSGLYRLYEGESDRWVLETGVSLPTGSIDEEDDTPMGRTRLPYPMQLGSGTVDLRPGLSYIGQSEEWGWGGHVGGTIRLGRNSNDYRLGHEAKATAWIARRLLPFLSLSLRTEGKAWGNIEGDDDRLNPATVPTADPDLRSGRRVDVLLGLNLFAETGPLAGNRLAVEAGAPVYQWLEGPQLETDLRLSVAWDWTF